VPSGRRGQPPTNGAEILAVLVAVVGMAIALGWSGSLAALRPAPPSAAHLREGEGYAFIAVAGAAGSPRFDPCTPIGYVW
jgi:hypothetical protein